MGWTRDCRLETGRARYLAFSPECVELIEANGGETFLRSLFNEPIGEALTKPGLDAWRDRRRLTLTDGNGNEQTAYLKRYRQPPWTQQLPRILGAGRRHGTAWREWEPIARLNRAGVPTLRPIALGQRMARCWEQASFILTEAVDGQALERWMPQHWVQLPAADRHEWIRSVAELVGRLHAACLCHRDLYLSHIYVRPGTIGRTQFTLIDLQRLFAPRWRLRRWRVKDLAQLNYSAPIRLVTRADRWRFLCTYLPAASRDERRWWMHDIVAKSRRIARHDRRRRARLAGGANA
jgi:heptose I phosphotransferase